MSKINLQPLVSLKISYILANVIPVHLEDLGYIGCVETVEKLGKLPVRSIDNLELVVGDKHHQFRDEFYVSISRLFEQLTVTKNARLMVGCDLASFDLQRINLALKPLVSYLHPNLDRCLAV